MKILNPNAPSLVIMSWYEFERILICLPERDLQKLLTDIGCEIKEVRERTKEGLIRKIFSEYEEQVY